MSMAHVDTPIGTLTIVGTDTGLRRVLWEGEAPPPDAGGTVEDAGSLSSAVLQIREYFAGSRTTFDLPLDLVGTPFQVRTWMALGSIPFGSTISYGEQARRIGQPTAARAVGAANGRNPVPLVLPCHRVIGSGGELTGFGGGLDIKQALLDHEAKVLANRA